MERSREGWQGGERDQAEERPHPWIQWCPVGPSPWASQCWGPWSCSPAGSPYTAQLLAIHRVAADAVPITRLICVWTVASFLTVCHSGNFRLNALTRMCKPDFAFPDWELAHSYCKFLPSVLIASTCCGGFSYGKVLLWISVLRWATLLFKSLQPVLSLASSSVSSRQVVLKFQFQNMQRWREWNSLHLMWVRYHATTWKPASFREERFTLGQLVSQTDSSRWKEMERKENRKNKKRKNLFCLLWAR